MNGGLLSRISRISVVSGDFSWSASIDYKYIPYASNVLYCVQDDDNIIDLTQEQDSEEHGLLHVGQADQL